MKFKISRNDMEEGKRYSVDRCPVALCIKRKKKKFYIMVTQSAVSCRNKKEALFSRLPSEMTSFIKKFDRGEAIEDDKLPCFNLNFRKMAKIRKND